MGLDITAFKNAVQVPNEDEDGRSVYPADKTLDRLDGMPRGSYKGEDEIGFRAGSYSGYNNWRTSLCRAALGVNPDVVWSNATEWQGKPFFELINFSDCEGAIGPVTSKKLAQDFTAEREKVKAGLNGMPDADWFWSRYDLWEKAFTLASESGFVIFH